MNGLTFHSPFWFWGLLILIPLFALRLRAASSRRRKLPGLVSPRLERQLVSGGSQIQRWVVFLFQSLALALTLTALARPQLGFDEVESEVQARNLFLAIDTSRSMLADDLRPTRLARAKLAAVDIISSLPEDRIGLIAFAGRPFLQAPLTVDHEAILEAVDQIDTEIIPRGGTNIAAAVELALETIAEAEVEQSALVIFSDGEALEGDEEVEAVKAKAREAALSIISVGVGTSDGAIIPELDERGNPIPGVFIKDEAGQVVRSRLDPAALQSVASGGGSYVHLGGSTSLSRVVQQIQRGIATSREQGDSRLRPIERFIWPLSFAVVCLILAHLTPVLWTRPARPTGLRTLSSASLWLLFGVFLGPVDLKAEDALFSGHEAFEQQQYDEAIQAYEGALSQRQTRDDVTRLNMAIGAAAFRKGDYERAAEAYGQALIEPKDAFREHAHYNLGNTLFRQGEAALKGIGQSPNPDQLQTLEGPPEQVEQVLAQWEGALEHYETALALNESNERTAHNIEVVKKRIEELKKEQEKQEEQQQEQQQDDQEQEENEEEQEEEDREGSENDEKNDEEQEGDDTEENQSEGNEEEQDQQNGDQEEESGEDQQEGESDQENEQQPENEGEGEESGQPENSPREEPEQPDAPQDGELKANPEQSQPQAPQPINPRERQTNPETGYAPSEARQLLEALADETEVRPVLAPSRGENYKNW